MPRAPQALSCMAIQDGLPDREVSQRSLIRSRPGVLPWNMALKASIIDRSGPGFRIRFTPSGKQVQTVGQPHVDLYSNGLPKHDGVLHDHSRYDTRTGEDIFRVDRSSLRNNPAVRAQQMAYAGDRSGLLHTARELVTRARSANAPSAAHTLKVVEGLEARNVALRAELQGLSTKASAGKLAAARSALQASESATRTARSMTEQAIRAERAASQAAAQSARASAELAAKTARAQAEAATKAARAQAEAASRTARAAAEASARASRAGLEAMLKTARATAEAAARTARAAAEAAAKAARAAAEATAKAALATANAVGTAAAAAASALLGG